MPRYVAEAGRVYAVHDDGTREEAGTALTADGRDLERHDRALNEARRQRARLPIIWPDGHDANRAACACGWESPRADLRSVQLAAAAHVRQKHPEAVPLLKPALRKEPRNDQP